MSEPFRVIIIEDDVDVAMFVKTVLEKRELCTVMTIGDPRQVAAAVRDFAPDVVITDIELPGGSGLELITQVREVKPGTPVIVMTAHASLDFAVTALRSHADEFLTKPVTGADLVAHVTRLGEQARAAAESAPKPKVVLAIGAHPDDVEVGVGGILAAHVAVGDSVTILSLTRGMRDTGIQGAWNELSASGAVIGAQVMLEDLPGNGLSTAPHTTEVIQKVIAELDPAVVYVHSKNDANLDHRAVHDATLIAAANVLTLACYQGNSATVDFRPNRFVTIEGFIDKKLEMIACYTTEGTRPRALQPDFVIATARAWSRYGQGLYCEPLEIMRDSAAVSHAE